MKYVICIVPAAPVRKKQSHKAEMTNQLLFGETMEVLKTKNKWLSIQSLHDNYNGWIRSNLVGQFEKNLWDDHFVTGDLFNKIEIAGMDMHIPMGATLPCLRKEEGEVANLKYRYCGQALNRKENKRDETTVIRLTSKWLNAPYLWGGRTPFGVDCSGFVQVIFKMLGVDILRDAWLQADQGIKVKSLQNAQCGNLAFFRNRKEKITHVGILLSPSQIVHASGKVRIDQIDEKGILNLDTGKRTHSLSMIRSYW